jgi:tape measure domain-containing protein
VPTVVEVMARFGADTSSFRRNVDASSESMRRFQRSAQDAGAQTDRAMQGMQTRSVALGSFLGNLAANALPAVIQGVQQFGMAVLGQASSMQQAEMAFVSFLGSAEKSKQFLDDLAKFAAKTPFEFPQLVEASKQMMAFGFAAQDILPMMTSIGDAAAGLGTGAEGIERITRQLGQMKMKGVAAGEELRVIAEVGIPAWQYLADTLGVTVPEAMKMAEKRLISADVAIAAITNGLSEGTKNARGFGGMMVEQSKTLQGVVSTFKDSVMNSLVKAVKPLIEIMTQVTAAATPFAEAFAVKIGEAITITVNVLMALGSALKPIVDLFMAIPTPVYAVVAAILAFRAASAAAQAGMAKMAPVANAFKVNLAALKIIWADLGRTAVQSGAQQAGVIARLRALTAGASASGAAMSALKGVGSGLLGMLGGPWGAVIGGATIGLMAFQQAQQDTQAAVDELTASLDAQSGAVTAATYREIADELRSNITEMEEWEALASEGLGMTEATAAIVQGGKALEEFEARLDAVATSTSDNAGLASKLGNQVDNLKDNLGDARLAWEANKAATEAAAQAQEQAAAPIGRVAQLEQAQAAAAKAAKDATDGLANSFKALKGLLDASAAKDNWTKAIKGLGDAAKESGKKILGNSDAALALRDAARSSIGDLMAYAESFKNPEKRAKALSDGMAAIRKTLIENGVKPADVDKFLKPFMNGAQKAKGQGEAIGKAVAEGTAAGIALNQYKVTSAATALGTAAKLAAMNALEIASPSKVFIRIGKHIGQGLAKGMEDSRSKVEKAADAMAQRAIDAFKARAQNALDLAKQVKDSIVSAGGVMGGVGDEAMSTDSVLGAMRTRVEQADEFRRQIKQLRKLGLNSTSLQEIIAAGVEQGGQVAAALLAGGASAINEVNSLEKMLAADAAAVGSMAAQDRYGMTTSQARAAQQINIAKGGVNVTFSSQVSKADRVWIQREVDKAVTAAVTRVVREANR